MAKTTTPMLAQYNRVKEQYPGCLLFFRLGDFFELFGTDAELAARELEITLTSREAGRGQRIPMCGVPHHAVEGYIATLVEKGYRVALCEQLEDPRTAKGVVKRDVVRVITPGTSIGEGLPPGQNRYLVAIHEQRGVWGLAHCDLSTGEFACSQVAGSGALDEIVAELVRLQPSELLTGALPDQARPRIDELGFYQPEPNLRLFERDASRRALLDHFQVLSLDGFGCGNLPQASVAAGAVIAYLHETQKTSLDHISCLRPYSVETFMMLDPATRRNLELTRTLRDGDRRGSLLWVLDHTATAMGARRLRQWLEQPLLLGDNINTRLDAVEDLVQSGLRRAELEALMLQVYDIPRLVSRITLETANARDLQALARSLEQIPQIRQVLQEAARSASLLTLLDRLDPCTDVVSDIRTTLVDDPPVSIKEGGLIRPGFSEEVDRLQVARRDGKSWIAALEHQERANAGIKSLKIGFNRVFGYYIEVTRPNLALVPSHYERKQTLASAERFVTPELKEQEALILGAEEKVVDLEYQLFCALRSGVSTQAARIQEVADALATLDAYQSLAHVALERHYVRPKINTAGRLIVQAGRHPVVETVLSDELFVPNDIHLDAANRQIVVLTGPNMAGKSTYLRQTALIVLLAHIGSFVPAAVADVPLVDRIFTRVGASDDLATGQSTFMVEMNEVANILNNATHRSLVILDEVGRGTSTFDGLSIAWAVTEHLHNSARCRPLTMFATHYHELTELAQLLPRVHNCSVAVKEERGQVVFLRRIVPGGADRSYGIEVARLAGLPEAVIDSARRVLKELESSEEGRLAREVMSGSLLPDDMAYPAVKRHKHAESAIAQQIPLFAPEPEPDPLVAELAALDVENITPLSALNQLFELSARARERQQEASHRGVSA